MKYITNIKKQLPQSKTKQGEMFHRVDYRLQAHPRLKGHGLGGKRVGFLICFVRVVLDTNNCLQTHRSNNLSTLCSHTHSSSIFSKKSWALLHAEGHNNQIIAPTLPLQQPISIQNATLVPLPFLQIYIHKDQVYSTT